MHPTVNYDFNAWNVIAGFVTNAVLIGAAVWRLFARLDRLESNQRTGQERTDEHLKSLKDEFGEHKIHDDARFDRAELWNAARLQDMADVGEFRGEVRERLRTLEQRLEHAFKGGS